MKHSKLQLQVLPKKIVELVGVEKLPGTQPVQGVYEGCPAEAWL